MITVVLAISNNLNGADPECLRSLNERSLLSEHFVRLN